MTKTLAQLKRDLRVGTKVKCLHNKYTPKFLNKVRTVKHADTTGIYLSDDMDTLAKGSFLGFPKADRLIYEGDIFGVYTQSECELSYQIIK